MQRQNLRRLILRLALSAALVSVSVLTPKHLSGQALPTRSRVAGASAFGTYTRLTTDYGSSGNGITVGGDYIRYLKFLSPAIEVRFKTGSGMAVREETFGGGLRIEHQIKYFHPYADLLINDGLIHFTKNGYIGGNGKGSNSSVVYSFGGGVDYDFADQWAARVDYQSEHWNLQTVPNVILTPRAFSFGILYRFRLGRTRD
jgi:opacity protein-like surface antigen